MIRATFLVVLVTATAASAQTLPAGAGADVLKAKCISCHEADIIVSQRLSLAAWTRSVDKMVRWGATITPAEREALHPYLAANFGAAVVAALIFNLINPSEQTTPIATDAPPYKTPK